MVTAKSSTSSTTLAQRPWKRGTVTPPAASTREAPVERQRLAGKIAARLDLATRRPRRVERPCRRQCELARGDLPAHEIAELGCEPEIGAIRAEADVARDLGGATELGLEEIELRQLDREVELAGRRLAAAGHDERGALACHATSLSVHASSKRQVAAPDSATWAVISSDRQALGGHVAHRALPAKLDAVAIAVHREIDGRVARERRRRRAPRAAPGWAASP